MDRNKRLSSRPLRLEFDITGLSPEAKLELFEKWYQDQLKDKRKIMLYMVMYDIEDNRIRTNIAKYLLRKGCMRIQKSVYLAKSSRIEYQEIYRVLNEINGMYENHDSIFLLPVPEEKFNHIKVIGKHVEFDLVIKNPNAVFI